VTDLIADLTATPDPGALPGGSALQQFINGSLFLALGLALIAFLIGAGMFAIGRHGGNMRASDQGKLAMFSGAAGAFFAGSAVAILNFFYHVGQQVR
jgi:hypothetical protein